MGPYDGKNDLDHLREKENTPMWAIETEALRFRYRRNSRWALDGVYFRQKIGTSVAVAGASGTGKSTWCRTINGLIPKCVREDFRGRVRILGEEIGEKRVADVARHVGLVFQDFEAQLFCTNGTLEVAFGPAIRDTDLSATALEGKGFGARGDRTYYVEVEMKGRDYGVLGLGAAADMFFFVFL